MSISYKTATRPYLWLVINSLGNGLVPLGNKPFPEQILTKFYDTISHHQATHQLSQAEFQWPWS